LINKKKVFLSVLVSNYNKEKYIYRCLNSLLKQSYKNFEVIFFDDSSSDNSVCVAKKFVTKINIKILINKKSKEEYNSYNQINSYLNAFSKAEGRIILLLDSDDFFQKNKLLKVANFFSNSSKNKILFDLPHIFFSKKKIKKFKEFKLFKTMWPRFPVHSCISLRKELFLKLIKNSVFIKKFPHVWMDFRISVYVFFVLKNYKILNENLTYYFQDPEGASSKYIFLRYKWWVRRSQSFEFIKYIFKKNEINFNLSLDYLLTRIVFKLLSTFFSNSKHF
jgi:glycosyltransferase involved in cell wall biosynthesis